MSLTDTEYTKTPVVSVLEAYKPEYTALLVYIKEEGNFSYTFGVQVVGIMALGLEGAIQTLIERVMMRIGRPLNDDADLGFRWLTAEDVQELRENEEDDNTTDA